MNMNNGYDVRQISTGNRRLNGVLACEVVAVDQKNKEITFRMPFGNETVRIHPSDFEITEYKVGLHIDAIVGTVNGKVRSAQLIGLTPLTFIPEK